MFGCYADDPKETKDGEIVKISGKPLVIKGVGGTHGVSSFSLTIQEDNGDETLYFTQKVYGSGILTCILTTVQLEIDREGVVDISGIFNNNLIDIRSISAGEFLFVRDDHAYFEIKSKSVE